MIEKHKVLFIDDELQGENSRMELVNSLNMDPRLEVYPVHPVDLAASITEYLIKSSYSLIIVDYKLSTYGNANGETYNSNGYSLTSLLKEKCPDTPVYLISQILTKDVSMGEHYDKMLSHSLLTKIEGRNLLVSDCNDYRFIYSKLAGNNNIEDIFNCVNVPLSSREGFYKSLPLEFKSGLKDRLAIQPSEVIDQDSSYLRFSKWINSTFVKRTGPLVSIFELAVLFGMESRYFEENFIVSHQEIFDNFQYKGPFANSNEKRWWMQSAFDFAIALTGKDFSSTPWRDIPIALNLDIGSYSVCAVCREKFPECTAFDIDDNSLTKKYSAHWSCVTLSQTHEELVGFDPVYILDEE